MAPIPILVVDDDAKLCRLLKSYLDPLGYAVDVAHNGREGLQLALEGRHSAVVLDVMMPGMNGFDVLRELRKRSEIPVLMLTALGEEPDRIAGLEVGADDYLPKTFSTRELLARLRAVLRRSKASPHLGESLESVEVGALKLDPGAREASLDGEPLTLTPIEYDLLLALARVPGRVKTREQLMLDVADREFEAFDRSIDVHISSVRRKLGDDAKEPRFIETIRGSGYRMRKPDGNE